MDKISELRSTRVVKNGSQSPATVSRGSVLFYLRTKPSLITEERMAFQSSTRPDIQNPQKKILEELNLRKQLLKIGTAQTLNPSALNTPIGVPLINSNLISSENQMSTTARAALLHANNASFGYFIAQESSFGNNILAVLPRFNENK